MKVILEDNKRFILRFDKGEELFSALSVFLRDKKITASHVTGIGTCIQVELGYYNAKTKTYERHNIEEDLEVLTFTGNTGIMDEKPVVHLHGSFSKRDLSVIGGHVFTMTVAATCELNLIKLDGEIERKKNEEFGLNLLS